jgi:hypothetical protein
MSSSVPRRKQILAEWSQPVVQEQVAPCKPCRPYTKGEDKPAWAVHGCGGGSHPHKNKIIVNPQFPEDQRPKNKKWGSEFRPNEGGLSCIHAECADYTKVYPTQQGVQQHARKHYPAEYSCSCGGKWYLKTEYNYHFLMPCPHCDKLFMKTSLSAHIKKCIH